MYEKLHAKYEALDRNRTNCFESMLIKRIEDPFGYWMSGYPNGKTPLRDSELLVELEGGYPG